MERKVPSAKATMSATSTEPANDAMWDRVSVYRGPRARTATAVVTARTATTRMPGRLTDAGGVGIIDNATRTPPVPYMNAVERVRARHPPVFHAAPAPRFAPRRNGT